MLLQKKVSLFDLHNVFCELAAKTALSHLQSTGKYKNVNKLNRKQSLPLVSEVCSLHSGSHSSSKRKISQKTETSPYLPNTGSGPVMSSRALREGCWSAEG